jgi:hypothetical protein
MLLSAKFIDSLLPTPAEKIGLVWDSAVKLKKGASYLN